MILGLKKSKFLWHYFSISVSILFSKFLFALLKVAGILQPNDGLCHLDSQGKYTMAEIQVHAQLYCVLV